MASSDFQVHNGKPTWRVQVEQPGGWASGEHSNEFRLFNLPGSAVLSWLLTLTDEAGESLVIHHAFDLSDAPMRSYLDRAAEGGRVLLVFEGAGALQKDCSVGSAKLRKLIDQGQQYNDRLTTTNGPEAVRVFLDAFTPVFREAGAHAAWEAVDRSVGFVSTSKPVLPPPAGATAESEAPGAAQPESQTSRVFGRKKPPGPEASSDPDTALHNGDFAPLLAATRADMYRQNAFRIAELPVHAPNRDLDRRQKVIEGAIEMGASIQRGPFRALPLTVSPETLKEAMARLRDPVLRIVDELFWFWPLGGTTNGPDPSIGLLAEHRVRPAFEAWKAQGAKDDPQGIALHNLAVLAHATALELEQPESAREFKDVAPEEAAGYWALAYRSWKMVMDLDPFWELLQSRIAELNDPRLPGAVARRIRRTLPLALLTINARLAIQSAERGNLAASDRHRQVMSQSGFDPAVLEKALRSAADPLRDRIGALADEAERDYLEDASKGLEIAGRLHQQAAGLLAAIDGLFPAGNPVRENAHDAIARRARTACVKFAGTQIPNQAVLDLLKKLLSVAEGASARHDLEVDIEDVQKIMAQAKDYEIYRTCYFCSKRPPIPDASATVVMYGNVTREYRQVKWQQHIPKIPRCAECQAAHKKTDQLSGRFFMVGVGLVILAAVGILLSAPKPGDAIAAVGCGGFIAALVVGGIFGAIGSAVGRARTPAGIKPEGEKKKFPTVLDALRQGWQFG
ncbi:MAG TPA: hypothetical protein VEN81_10185, partial [Planctomycetota bacterium]|nr:hypothetical protein [Planctomycetota bacterium]